VNHKSLAMTLRHAHLAQGHKIKAVGVLDEATNPVMVAGFSKMQMSFTLLMRLTFEVLL